MVEAVVVALVLDAGQLIFEEVFSDDRGSLARTLVVDISMGSADGSHVRVKS